MSKIAPLECEEEMRILFDSICVTNATSFVPGGSEKASTQGEEEIWDHDVVDVEKEANQSADIPSPVVGKRSTEKQPSPHGASPKGKKGKKTYKDGLMKRLVNAYEKKSESSKNSATSTMVDPIREEIAQLLDVVIKSGTAEGSDGHYYATQLLIKKKYCDVFITLKTPTGRLTWLKRTWEDRKKN
jgi:hypothetical protein